MFTGNIYFGNHRGNAIPDATGGIYRMSLLAPGVHGPPVKLLPPVMPNPLTVHEAPGQLTMPNAITVDRDTDTVWAIVWNNWEGVSEKFSVLSLARMIILLTFLLVFSSSFRTL